MENIFSDKDEELKIEIPKEKRYLNTASYDYSVEFLVDLMSGDNPKIILEVPFQRNFIWSNERASQLVESVIMNVPIPPLYFAEEEDGKWLVIDGLQRLNSLLSFYQNEYPLKGLEIIKELEKLKHKDLPPKAKALLNDGLLRVNVIKKDSHPDIKYDIFMRLNKGSVSLNYQELRNCLYRGNFNNALKEIVKENKRYLKILSLKEPHDRFQDIEFITRYFAMKENLAINDESEYYVKGYTGKMVSFLNNYMSTKKKVNEAEADKYIIEFNGIIDKVLIVFSEKEAFKDPDTKISRVNRSLGEIVMLGMSNFETNVIETNKVLIKELLYRELRTNEKFRKSIAQGTSETETVNFRINYWLKCLQNEVKI